MLFLKKPLCMGDLLPVRKIFIERPVSGKILKDKAYEIGLNPKYDGHQRVLASMVYKFFDRKTGFRATSKARTNVNEVLAWELHKPVNKKNKKKENVCKV